MDSEKSSYKDFVRFRNRTNPCITGLMEHLERGRENASTVAMLEYSRNSESPRESLIQAEADLAKLVAATSTTRGRILFVENIRPRLISVLGEILDVDPIFFAGHVATDFPDIEQAPPPPALALFPSQAAEWGYLHIHYQRVIDLGSADSFRGSAYALKTDSNIPRNTRRLPPLSGRQLALARACCSVLVKKLQTSWVCTFPRSWKPCRPHL